jgi:hypothetical protein
VAASILAVLSVHLSFLVFLVSSRTFFSWLGVASIFDQHRAPTSSFDCWNEKTGPLENDYFIIISLSLKK